MKCGETEAGQLAPKGGIDPNGTGTNCTTDRVGSHPFPGSRIHAIRSAVSSKKRQSAGMALTFDAFELPAETNS